MKKKILHFALMAPVMLLALAAPAFAEPSDTLKAVYDSLIAEGSAFSQSKALYTEYYEGVSMDAALEDTAITITLDSENEYVESGSWTFTEEGGYLTTTLSAEDFYGAGMSTAIMDAAVSAQGVNTALFNGYISALTLTDQDSSYLLYEQDEAAGTIKYSINITGPYEMEGIDEMVLTEDILQSLGYGPMDETYTSTIVNFGKVSLLINGSAESAKFLVGEYGELDDLAFQAITAAAKTFQPAGWEDFTAAFTELKDVEGENFSAALNQDEAAVTEIIEDPNEGYSYAIINIGQTSEE